MLGIKRAPSFGVIVVVVAPAIQRLFGAVAAAAPVAALDRSSVARIIVVVVGARIVAIVFVEFSAVALRAAAPGKMVASMSSFTAIQCHIFFLHQFFRLAPAANSRFHHNIREGVLRIRARWAPYRHIPDCS